MLITMSKKVSGLSQDYYLETLSHEKGCDVVVRDLNNDILGQFRASNIESGNITNIVAYSRKMNEVVFYFTAPINKESI